MPLIRINKYLSQCGIASRRKADELIARGAVSVNGERLYAPGLIIDTLKDTVSVKGKELRYATTRSYTYYLLNKPKEYITTAADTHGRKTVFKLLPKLKGFFPVGRLDMDTTGLLLITNDGEVAHRLMHPSFEIEKRYLVSIEAEIPDGKIARLSKGVEIGDERPSVLKILNVKQKDGVTEIDLEIHEGRKRQIRRTFEEIGYKVKDLKRTAYAGLKLDVKESSYRKLDQEEIQRLKKKVGLI